MKVKVFCICLVIILLAPLLCACGNQGLGFGNYSFKHIHFSDGSGESYCATVETWYDNEMGIEVRTSEYGAIYLAEGLYILFENGTGCPYCK